MRCVQVRRALSAYLDGELPESRRQAVAAHLEGCAACRAEHEALAATWDALLLSPEAPAAPGFEARLRERIAAGEEAPPTLSERLRGAFWTPARRLALSGALAGIVAGWMLGRAPAPAAPTTSDAGRVALRREVARAFALDLFAEVPPESAGAAYVRLTGYGRSGR